MTDKEKLQAFVKEINSVIRKHNITVDKYANENGTKEYIFKLQFGNAEIEIDDLFSTIYHGPPRSN